MIDHPEYLKLALYVGKLLAESSEEEFKLNLDKAINSNGVNNVVSFVNQHHLVPILFDKISNIAVDSDFKVKITGLYMLERNRRETLLKLITSFLRSLNSTSIRYILVKGISIERYAYKNSWRTFSDLDLLIDPYGEKRFKQFVSWMGGELILEKKVMPSSEINVNGLLVDAHYFSFFSTFPELLKHSRRVDIDGAGVNILSPEDLFIYVCCHLSLVHRYWPILSWVYDVYRFVKYGPLDWDKVGYKGNRYGVMDLVSRSIEMVSFFIDSGFRSPLSRRFRRSPFEPPLNYCWKGKQDSRIMTELSLLFAHKNLHKTAALYARRLCYGVPVKLFDFAS